MLWQLGHGVLRGKQIAITQTAQLACSHTGTRGLDAYKCHSMYKYVPVWTRRHGMEGRPGGLTSPGLEASLKGVKSRERWE